MPEKQPISIENRKRQKVHDKAVQYMYQDIDQVIAEDVEPAELVIEGKGKINNCPRIEKPPRRGKVRQIPDHGVLYNGVDVVKDKGAAPGVTVNNKGRKGYDNQRKPPRQKNLFHSVLLPYPSAILLGIDRTALLIWEVKPKPSFLGNVFVAL